MALPSNVSLVTLSGTYVDYSGAPIAGSIRFTSSQTLRDMLADVIIVASTSTATLDSNGSFSIVLPATNDPDLSAVFTYRVEEAFTGGRSYTISLVMSSPTNTMANVAPTYIVSPTYYSFVSASTWADLDAIVQDMDTKVVQSLGGFASTVPYTTYAQIASNYATYSAVSTYYSTYASILTVGPIIYASSLTPYVSQAQTQQTNAESSLASAQVSLSTVLTENDSHFDDFMIVGA